MTRFHILLTGTLALLTVFNAQGQLLEGDDLILTDPTPGIVFDDTDSGGWEFVIRGREDFFHINEEGEAAFLYYDPSLNSLALGFDASSGGSSSIALGRSASSGGSSSIALGRGASSASNSSIALGRGASSGSVASTALGYFASSGGSSSIALGRSASSGGFASAALGVNASSAGEFSTAIGYLASAPNTDTIVLGEIPGVNNGLNYTEVANGTTNPLAPLHIFRDDETQEMLYLENAEAGGPQDRAMMYLQNNGGIRFEFNNPALGTAWRFQAATGNEDVFEIAKVGTGQIEMTVDAAGNMEIKGTLTEMSDRNAKERIERLAGDEVLERLRTVPVSEWSYIDTPQARHAGPMAQDFYAAFGLGRDEKHISARDMAGVSLAAVKELERQNRELREINAVLAGRMEKLELTLASFIESN